MSESISEADEVAALFQKMCAGDPVAQSAFIEAVLDPLVGHLRRRHGGADEHACLSAAEDAVLDLIRKPSSYDPAKRGLLGFLRMSAERDLLNALAKERKHHIRREPAESVELAPDDGNVSEDTLAADLPSFDDPVFAEVIASFTATERAVFDLMRAGERATAAYAPLIGVAHLPEGEQRHAVKKIKERVFKRLQRAAEGTT